MSSLIIFSQLRDGKEEKDSGGYHLKLSPLKYNKVCAKGVPEIYTWLNYKLFDCFHAQFQNHRTTSSGRKVTSSEEEIMSFIVTTLATFNSHGQGMQSDLDQNDFSFQSNHTWQAVDQFHNIKFPWTFQLLFWLSLTDN